MEVIPSVSAAQTLQRQLAWRAEHFFPNRKSGCSADASEYAAASVVENHNFEIVRHNVQSHYLGGVRE